MKQLIEINDETREQVRRVVERFAGDPETTLNNLSDIGIHFGRITTADPVETDDKPENTQAEQPKEWIERQEEERRAWAIGQSVEILQHADSWDQSTIIDLAKQIVNYVKGENADLNDVAATDAFYLIAGEMLEEFDEVEHSTEEIEDFLIKVVDRLAKEGVRLKDGEKLEYPA